MRRYGQEEPIASTVGEIGASAEFYDYDDKYKNGTSQLYIPARLPEEKIEEIRAIAKRAYHMLGCRGLAVLISLCGKKTAGCC